MQKRIAIQGQRASFHDAAARQYFGEDISLVCLNLPFANVFNALEQGKADFAVCAIENSLYGAINEVYDLLLEKKTWICGEVILPIEQCLIGTPESSIDSITEVYSHPVAFAQCEVFLKAEVPHAQRFESDDTAGSVAQIAKLHDAQKAAIASQYAAAFYGMKVLQAGIETNRHNFTRFVVLSPDQQPTATLANKTSLVIKVPHKPGSLYQALGHFASHNINLSLIASRPIAGTPGSYMFYIDCMSGIKEKSTASSLESLQRAGCQVRVLGSYNADNSLAHYIN